MENNRKKGTARVKFLKHIEQIRELYHSGYCEKDVQRLSGLSEEMSYQTFRYNLRKYVKEDGAHNRQMDNAVTNTQKAVEYMDHDILSKLQEIQKMIESFRQDMSQVKHYLHIPQQNMGARALGKSRLTFNRD